MYFRTILKLFIEFLRTAQKKSINQISLINTLSDFCNFLEFPQNCYRMVEATGIEPATSWSQTTRATNCATPRNIIFFAQRLYIIAHILEICNNFCKFFCKIFKNILKIIPKAIIILCMHQQLSWIECSATNRKVGGSNPSWCTK